MSEEEPGSNARMSEEDGESPSRLLRGKAPWLLGGAGAIGLILLGIWTQRAPIAENFIGRELEAMGVRARYDLASIGLHTHRIENIVLGDPANPDLTAKWVEVDLTLSGLSPGVAAVRAGGVRLHGRVHNGVLSLGELDKFRDPASTAPFSMPNLLLALDDARMRLDTDAGQIGLKIDGRGNLRNGFSGKLAAVMPNASLSGCGVAGATAYVDVAMKDGSPRIRGPVRAKALNCADAGLAMAMAVADVDVTLARTLDKMAGQGKVEGEALRLPGVTFARPSGHILFDGGAKSARGQFDLASGPFSGGKALAAGTEISGSWSFTNAGEGFRARVEGTASAEGIRMADADPLAFLRSAAAQTPVGPLAVKLADAVREIGKSNRIRTRYAVSQRGGKGTVVLQDADLVSRSGARIAPGQGTRFSLAWPGGDWTVGGNLTMEGGGLPKAALRLSRQTDGGYAGQLFVEDYAANGARLALEPVRFTSPGDGTTRITTALMLDGPLPDGSLKGLSVPIEGRVTKGGVIALNPACAPVGLASLDYGGFALDKTKLTLCPTDGALLAFGKQGLSGGGEVRAPRLSGKLGQSAMRLSADLVRFTLAEPGFMARKADLSIGPAVSPVRLTAATLIGKAAGSGFGGTLEGATGRIGAVPLLASDASGRWGFAQGALKVQGGLTLSDTAVPDRFSPLVSRDFALSMQNNRIAAKGTLVEPRGGATIVLADIVHDLGSAKGKADLSVPGITFSPGLQPEAISRLALGVVANASGTVTGNGQIRWAGDKVTSDGVFRTDAMDLAAAFGPVSGLSGEIHFTDLINLITAPHQEVRLASVNPGVEVTDGVVRYQLIDGQKVRVEGGDWPFSGGQLILLPTILDFGANAERYLTFRVIGLQAGAFIQKMELDNISATGVFDGIMPLIFNAEGGRIAGGVLVARQEGMPPLVMPEGVLPSIPCDPTRQSGTLSYVGPVSNEQVGVFGKLAFDALKNLQYKCLTILMDGSLDGEMVTNVVFNGVNKGQPNDAPQSYARSFMGLPFLFNVKIQAPFRGLLGTAKSFIDPSGLVRDKIGDDYQRKLSEGVAVQRPESDTMPSGEQQ